MTTPSDTGAVAPASAVPVPAQQANGPIDPYLPIVYVRGFAMTDGEVEETTIDPFNGFNSGSSHIRVGARGEPNKYFFESPVVRLMGDYDYLDTFDGHLQGLAADKIQKLKDRGKDPKRTIWIFRYYDKTAESFGHGSIRLGIEAAAFDLAVLVKDIKEVTGAPMVHLVAHSMGGLICRSLIQKIYKDRVANFGTAKSNIARIFTYGTPHGGIELRSGLGGLGKWLINRDYDNDIENFGIKRMYQYLTPGETDPDARVPGDFRQEEIPDDAFDIDRIFNLIGTNAKDYEVAKGGSSLIVGPQSDGLVQIENAAVRVKGRKQGWAHRAYVHRSHSGRYGMVNSEEGYINLERFLFGTIQAMVSLGGVKGLARTDEASIQMDIKVSIRGLPVFMHERSRENYTPIVLNEPVTEAADDTCPLFTTFLNDQRAKSKDQSCQFVISVALYEYKVNSTTKKIDYSSKLHGVADWSDQLSIDVKLADANSYISYRWLSDPQDQPDGSKAQLVPVQNPDGWKTAIEFPSGSRALKILKGDGSSVPRFNIEAYSWKTV